MLSSDQQMTPPSGLGTRLLITSAGAGSMTPSVQASSQTLWPRIVDFDSGHDFVRLNTADARVVGVGGDGTIGCIARKLADTSHPVGIMSLRDQFATSSSVTFRGAKNRSLP